MVYLSYAFLFSLAVPFGGTVATWFTLLSVLPNVNTNLIALFSGVPAGLTLVYLLKYKQQDVIEIQKLG